MGELSDFTAAIEARLKALPALAGIEVLVEDAAELESKINTALAELGMLILIGEPSLDNTTPTSRVGNMKISSSLAVGENPTIWRGVGKPVCVDVAGIVVKGLQGLAVAGFQPLRVLRADKVPDKRRQIYEIAIESMVIVHPTQ